MAVTLLKGTAYLTGAASGIGRATSFAFAQHGITRLALTDVNLSNLQKTAAELQAQYPKLEILSRELDVCDETAVAASVAATVKRFGRIDVAVNVAGIGGNGQKTHETETSNWDKVIDVNLNGVWRVQKAVLKYMVNQEDLGPRLGRGNIVNVASMLGTRATPPHIPANSYVASKHAVVGLTKHDALTYGSQNIRINAMCPGYVNTPLLRASFASGAMSGEQEKVALGRLAEVEEIADSIVFLASPLASYLTAGVVVVDGGYTAN